MRGFAYLASLNLVGLSDPCWKWASCRLCMIRDEADCEGEEYWVRSCSGLGGGVVRNIPLIRTTYILPLAGREHQSAQR